TNKDAILKAVYQGNGQVAKNPIPPILWSYNNAVQDYPYDPAKAKQLLAQAGYPNGFEVDLWYLPVTRPYNPDGKRMAELIQADWAKIGVKINLVTYEWAEYRKRSKTGEQAVMMFGWSGDNGDPDNFFVPLLGYEGECSVGARVVGLRPRSPRIFKRHWIPAAAGTTAGKKVRHSCGCGMTILRATPVVPAKAGTQCRSKDAGFPHPRE